MAVTKSIGKPLAVALSLLGALLASAAFAQDAAPFFQQSCVACHTIGGGRRVGPDLKGVTGRKDRAWLISFINDPQGVLASGDPYALQLKQAVGGALMIKVPGITPELAGRLLDYIQSQSGAGATAPAAAEPAASPAEVAAGQSIFTGAAPLLSGGPACISCHATRGLPALGGGLLGPDLTQAAGRLGGRAGLSAWLASPPTPTMRSVFGRRPLAPVEVAAVTAYFQSVNAGAAGPAPALKGGLVLAGAGGAAACLLAFGLAWRRRLRAVRAPLVEKSRKGTPHG